MITTLAGVVDRTAGLADALLVDCRLCNRFQVRDGLLRVEDGPEVLEFPLVRTVLDEAFGRFGPAWLLGGESGGQPVDCWVEFLAVRNVERRPLDEVTAARHHRVHGMAIVLDALSRSLGGNPDRSGLLRRVMRLTGGRVSPLQARQWVNLALATPWDFAEK